MPTGRSKRFKSKTIQQWSGGESVPNLSLMEPEKWIEGRVNGGIITSIDSTDIPLTALQRGLNFTVRYDKTSRRFGTVLFGPTKPDSNSILKFFGFKLPNNDGHILRFTQDSIYDLQDNETTWVPITGILNGSDVDRFNVVVLFDRLTFSNNGVNPIQEIDLGADTFDQLGNAPPLRYITGFYNRVVGAAVREDNEVLLQWSAEYPNIDEWDPLVNETAGSVPLVDSPSDTGDHIKGIFALTNTILIIRERSIWVATKQASPTNPFHPYSVLPGIGTDSPATVKVRSEGLVWMDRRTNMIYSWALGGQLELIGAHIYNKIFNNITNPDTIFANYDPIEDEYSVTIPPITWTYNFRTKAWAYNELPNIYSDDSVELQTPAITIDELLGTINNLQGTIDELSPVVKGTTKRIMGTEDGDLIQFDPSITTDLGLAYPTQLVSKQFVIPSDNIYVAKIMIEVKFTVEGILKIFYSLDGGDSEDYWRLAKEKIIGGDLLGRRIMITYKKMIRTRKFAWKIETGTTINISGGQYDVLGYEIHVYPAGEIALSEQTR